MRLVKPGVVAGENGIAVDGVTYYRYLPLAPLFMKTIPHPKNRGVAILIGLCRNIEIWGLLNLAGVLPSCSG